MRVARQPVRARRGAIQYRVSGHREQHLADQVVRASSAIRLVPRASAAPRWRSARHREGPDRRDSSRVPDLMSALYLAAAVQHRDRGWRLLARMNARRPRLPGRRACCAVDGHRVTRRTRLKSTGQLRCRLHRIGVELAADLVRHRVRATAAPAAGATSLFAHITPDDAAALPEISWRGHGLRHVGEKARLRAKIHRKPVVPAGHRARRRARSPSESNTAWCSTAAWWRCWLRRASRRRAIAPRNSPPLTASVVRLGAAASTVKITSLATCAEHLGELLPPTSSTTAPARR